MSTPSEIPESSPMMFRPAVASTMLEGLRGKWGWFLALGIALIVLGTIALTTSWIATLAALFVFAWAMMLAGGIEIFFSFAAPRWSGFFLHLLDGVLSLVIGLLTLAHPDAMAKALTLLIAAYFLIAGTFRVAAAVALRLPNWGWELLSGSISILLGLMIAMSWPSSALWVIGTFVGIDLIFRGWFWVMISFAVRRLPKLQEH